jgi:hypothetical protein
LLVSGGDEKVKLPKMPHFGAFLLAEKISSTQHGSGSATGGWTSKRFVETDENRVYSKEKSNGNEGKRQSQAQMAGHIVDAYPYGRD